MFYLKIYLFIFRERGKEGEREGNISVWLPLARYLLGTWPATQACALTGNELVTLWFTSQHAIHWVTPVRAVLFCFRYICLMICGFLFSFWILKEITFGLRHRAFIQEAKLKVHLSISQFSELYEGKDPLCCRVVWCPLCRSSSILGGSHGWTCWGSRVGSQILATVLNSDL